jgi:hypothetical protein
LGDSLDGAQKKNIYRDRFLPLDDLHEIVNEESVLAELWRKRRAETR